MNSCKPCSLEDFKAWDGYIERLCLLKPKDRMEQLMFNTWERKQPQCKSRENYVCDLNSAELKRWLGGRGTYCSAEGRSSSQHLRWLTSTCNSNSRRAAHTFVQPHINAHNYRSHNIIYVCIPFRGWNRRPGEADGQKQLTSPNRQRPLGSQFMESPLVPSPALLPFLFNKGWHMFTPKKFCKPVSHL